MFLGKLFSIFHELLLVFRKLLCNVKILRKKFPLSSQFPPARSALRGCSGSGSLTRETKDCMTCSVLVAGFQFSAAMMGRQTCRQQNWEDSNIGPWLGYLSFLVDIGMIDLGSEGDLRWLEGILRGEYDVYQKCALQKIVTNCYTI